MFFALLNEMAQDRRGFQTSVALFVFFSMTF